MKTKLRLAYNSSRLTNNFNFSIFNLLTMSVKFNLKLLAILFSLGFIFTSCDDDDVTPELENEEEEITTVKLTFDDTNTAATDDVVAFWRDLDGDGGNAPTIDAITLVDGATYTLSVEFLNENENEDITEEVAEEDEEHQVFFIGSAIGNLLNITYNDTDDDGNPLGLSNNVSLLQTGGPLVLTVILRHEPNKTAAGVAQGNPDNAGGETDVEVDFDITVQ